MLAYLGNCGFKKMQSAIAKYFLCNIADCRPASKRTLTLYSVDIGNSNRVEI